MDGTWGGESWLPTGADPGTCALRFPPAIFPTRRASKKHTQYLWQTDLRCLPLWQMEGSADTLLRKRRAPLARDSFAQPKCSLAPQVSAHSSLLAPAVPLQCSGPGLQSKLVNSVCFSAFVQGFVFCNARVPSITSTLAPKPDQEGGAILRGSYAPSPFHTGWADSENSSVVERQVRRPNGL